MKEDTKLTVIIIGIVIFIIATLFIYSNKVEKINNGELTVVSESYMDR